MTKIENNNDLATAKPSGSGGVNIYLVGALIIAFVGLIVYQFLSCSGCYMAS